MSHSKSFDNLHVFYGRATDSSAHVYVRVAKPLASSNPRLAGTVRGPHAEGLRTLPTSIDLVDLGPGDSVLARAIVPDPTFWSPAVPAVYDVTIELCDDCGAVETAARTIGIRQFGARERSWFFGGRRWVLRGVIVEQLPVDRVEFLQSTNTSVVCKEPDEEMCETASRQGIVLVPWIAARDETQVINELSRLSRWPAVSLAIVDSDMSQDADLRLATPNVELVQLCRGEAAEKPGAQWATAFAGIVDDPARFGRRFGTAKMPVLAIRATAATMELGERREACDRLQRDLAQHGDFAGYIV